MGGYKEGLKRKVAEYKFLIHDLRVEKFVNDIVHFHVTLNTDLEIYNIEQAQALHSEDLHELKMLASEMRKSVQMYSNAVRSFSPDEKIIAVPFHDPVFSGYRDVSALPQHILQEMSHFFEVYKALEHSETSAKRVENCEAARKIITDSLEAYRREYPAK